MSHNNNFKNGDSMKMNYRVGKERLTSMEVKEKKKPLMTGWIMCKMFAEKYKSILLYFLMIILFWICLSLGESEWPHKVSYAYHEAFYIPVNIGMFVIPIVAVFMIFSYLIKVARKENTKQNAIHLLFFSAISATHIFLLVYVFSISTTLGYAVIEGKEIVNDAYYIYVDDGDYSSVRLRCTAEVYDQLVVDKDLAYRIEYKSSSLLQRKEN